MRPGRTGRRRWLVVGAALAAIPWIAAAWHVDGAHREATAAQLRRFAAIARALEAPTVATIASVDHALLDAKRRIERGERVADALAGARAAAGDLPVVLAQEAADPAGAIELRIGPPERGQLPLSRAVFRGDPTAVDGKVVARLDTARLRRPLQAAAEDTRGAIVLSGLDGVPRVSVASPPGRPGDGPPDAAGPALEAIVRRAAREPEGTGITGHGRDARLAAWRRLAAVPLVVVVSASVADTLPDWVAYRDAVLGVAALASAGLVAVFALAALALRARDGRSEPQDARGG